MKILVFGAGGFIGHHLVNRLKHNGHYVCGVDIKHPEFSKTTADDFIIADLTHSESFNSLPNLEFDQLYQLAADMGGAEYVFSGENDANIMSINALININTLNYVVKAGVKKVFYSSSACIYPGYNQLDPHNPDCSEDSAYPANPDSEYGWEKLFSERLYLSYAKNYNVNVRIARYHNIYGPEGTWQGGREKAPAAICRKVITSTNNIEIFGDGNQTRSFLYIDDCIDGTLALTSSNYCQPLNIGSTEMVTINKLVDVALSIKNKVCTKVYINGPVGVMGRCSDNKKINAALGWEPKVNLQAGMFKTYNWILTEHDQDFIRNAHLHLRQLHDY